MIDICMALDQSVSPHTGVRTIQNTGFSGRWYFNRLIPTPFFWNTALPPNFNLAPTQYRQLRRLVLSFVFSWLRILGLL